MRLVLFWIGLTFGCSDEASVRKVPDAAATSQDSGADALLVDSASGDSSSSDVTTPDAAAADASAACITVEDPAKGVPSSKQASDSTAEKHTFFFKNIAVDPNMTGQEGSSGYSPYATLTRTQSQLKLPTHFVRRVTPWDNNAPEGIGSSRPARDHHVCPQRSDGHVRCWETWWQWESWGYSFPHATSCIDRGSDLAVLRLR